MNIKFITLIIVPLVFSFTIPSYAIAKKDFNYAIIASRLTNEDKDWKKVVDILSGKYKNTKIFLYGNSLDELIKDVTKYSPDYIAFVAKPEDSSPDFVRKANQFNRKLGSAPYGKAVIGIITGFTPRDAFRIANHRQKLEIDLGMGGMLGFIDALPSGLAYCEFYSDRKKWESKDEGKPVMRFDDGPEDHITDMVEMLNSKIVDIIWTSGHASSDNWQVYYPDSPSWIEAQNGNLTGYAGEEEKYPINSPNPKIYLGIGNCLTACIDDKNKSYALAWMHSGGAYQFFGYTVSTYYGMMGWGMADYFFYRNGLYNPAESTFIINQALIMAMENGLAGDEKEDMEYDKDTCIVYGDPAWDARIPQRSAVPASSYSYSLDKSASGEKTVWTLKVMFSKSIDFNCSEPKDIRPVFAFSPEKIKKPKPVGDLSNVRCSHISDNFVIVLFKGSFKKGETAIFKFEAE